MKGRLVWINAHANSQGHGGGTRHLEVGRELMKAGVDVTVVSADFHAKNRAYTVRAGPGDREPRRTLEEGVPFRWVWTAPYTRNDWRRLANWWSFFTGVPRATRDLTDLSLVIGSSPHLFGAWAGLRLARKRRVPFVFEVRDLWPESLLAVGRRKGPFYRLLDLLARRLYRAADAIMVLSEGSREYLVRRGIPGERVWFVPNGVDPEPLAGCGVGGDGGPRTFVYAGAHGPANDLGTVIRAAAALPRGADLRVRLVGDGPEKVRLTALRDELGARRVHFHDVVPKRELPSVFHGAHVGLMILKDAELFRFGVSPNKLFDYMAAGLPVLCNVPGEVAGIVAEAGCGITVAPGSSEALGEGMERFLAMDLPGLRAMGERGRAWVQKNRNRRVLAEALLGHLEELPGEGGG